MLIFGQSLTSLFPISHWNDLVHKESIGLQCQGRILWIPLDSESTGFPKMIPAGQVLLSATIGLRVNSMRVVDRGEACPFLLNVYRI